MLSIILGFLFSTPSFSQSLPSCTSAVFENGDQWLIVDNQNAETRENINIVVATEDECEVRLNIVAIGGGGDSDTFYGHGGGSGYVTQKQVSVVLHE